MNGAEALALAGAGAALATAAISAGAWALGRGRWGGWTALFALAAAALAFTQAPWALAALTTAGWGLARLARPAPSRLIDGAGWALCAGAPWLAALFAPALGLWAGALGAASALAWAGAELGGAWRGRFSGGAPLATAAAWGALGGAALFAALAWAGWTPAAAMAQAALAAGTAALALGALGFGDAGLPDAAGLPGGRAALAAAAAGAGAWDWDMRADRLWVAPSVEAALGLARGALNGPLEGWTRLVHPLDALAWRRATATMRARADAALRLELRMARAEGGWRWMELRVASLGDGAGAPARCVGLASGGLERRKREERALRRRVLRDALTGLPTRALFLDRAERALAGARGALLVAAADRMTALNQSLGREGGDDALRLLARRTERFAAEHEGGAARLDGDMFGVFAPCASSAQAEALGAALAEALARPASVGGRETPLSASVGAATLEGPRADFDATLRAAEEAALEAKRQGAGRVARADADTGAGADDPLAAETALRRALETGAIEARFQPIVTLADGKVAGFEALARWRREEGDALPAAFLDAAERSGLIYALDMAILEQTVRALAEWRTAWRHDPPLFASVNISRLSFFHEGLAGDVKRALSAAKWLTPGAVALEISEATAMEDPEAARAILEELRATSVALAVDDFGAGHASFGRLHQFAFDIVKIDRSLLEGDPAPWHGQAVARAVASLTRDLDMRMVAEGVDAEAKAAMLRAMGCAYGQGELFAAAMTPAEARGWVARNRPR